MKESISPEPGPPRMFREKLRVRVERAGLVLKSDDVERFERYYNLLSKWNGRINLTALPLADYPAATLDRLFVEPLIAAELVENVPLNWLDLGSGGGSPAIPLKVARPATNLTMVDSKARKTVFLREASRIAELRSVNVLTTRIEDLPTLFAAQTTDLLTIRGVRIDESVSRTTHHLLKPGGRMLRFGPEGEATPNGFRPIMQQKLMAPGHMLMVLERL